MVGSGLCGGVVGSPAVENLSDNLISKSVVELGTDQASIYSRLTSTEMGFDLLMVDTQGTLALAGLGATGASYGYVKNTSQKIP